MIAPTHEPPPKPGRAGLLLSLGRKAAQQRRPTGFMAQTRVKSLAVFSPQEPAGSAAVTAASWRGVLPHERGWGETPPELAGADTGATASLRFKVNDAVRLLPDTENLKTVVLVNG
jgi:hypothetical protein